MKTQEEKDYLKSVGKRIKQRRKAKNLTQATVAEQIGLAETSYSRFESGNQAISMIKISKLAEVLGADLNYVLLGKERDIALNTISLDNCPERKRKRFIESVEILKDLIAED